jgi:hypothetical protein
MTVTQMFPKASVFGGYGRADFNIDTAPLQYIDGWGNVKRASKRVIFRVDTGDELGIHGDRYKPVAPKHMIDATRAIILRSDLNTDGIEERIDTSHCGKRTFVRYKLPNHTYTTPEGDTASLCLLAITSFDSKWPFMISVAAEQFACTNLQVFTMGEVALYKSKHIQSLDVDKGSRIIVKALDVVNNQQDQWHQWYNTPVSLERAAEHIAKFTNTFEEYKDIIDNNIISSHINYNLYLKRNNTNVNYILKVFKEYQDRLGPNYWALYNALTDWSTHAGFSRRVNYDTVASAKNDRMERVRKYVTTNFGRQAA